MPKEKPTLLVTGASGLLGDALCRLALGRWSVHATCRRSEVQVPGIIPVRVDLTDDQAPTRLLQRTRPQAVIHAAAESQVMECESNPGRTRRINVDVPARLAEACNDRQIDCLFISTDLVFDGRDAPYREGDKTGPLCEYARQKRDAERAVLDHCPGALVCRLPLMFGLAPNAVRHFTVRLLSSILSQRPVKLLVDEFRTPVDTATAAAGMLQVIGKASGIVHLGGRERISRYALGLLMAKQLKCAPTMLRPVTIEDLQLPVARAPDCSLASDTAYALGYDPPPLESAVASVVQGFLTP